MPQDVVERGIGHRQTGPRLGRWNFFGISIDIKNEIEAAGEAAFKTAPQRLQSRSHTKPNAGIGMKLAAELTHRIETALDNLLDFDNPRLEFRRSV